MAKIHENEKSDSIQQRAQVGWDQSADANPLLYPKSWHLYLKDHFQKRGQLYDYIIFLD